MGFSKVGKIIAVVIGAIVIVALFWGAASYQPSKKTVKDSEIVTITILNNIGIDRIVVMNQNTRDTIILTIIDLPYQFNCTRGNRISATITTTESFQWNTMEFYPVGFFDNGVHKNGVDVVSFVADGNIVRNNEIILNPRFTDLEVSPTSSPVPFVSPSPTPIE